MAVLLTNECHVAADTRSRASGLDRGELEAGRLHHAVEW